MAWLLDTVRKRNLLPRMSDTERAALEAGSVWIDGEIFSGKPDLERLASIPYSPDGELSPEERAFLDGPVDELCALVDDWELTRTRTIPAPVWDLLKREGFLGLTLPTEYGGRGFSTLAASTVFAKVTSRSLGLSAVVLIPNSVGPGELLLEYGTEEQKEHFLPRLARGDEIPCFALTEPEAGSDAASIRSRGTVFRGEDGTPMMRLDWDKRYITLAPVGTLLGLAFKLEDPEEILGKGPEPGITFALVPTDAPGVEVGRYHDPMGIAFPNGPTRGRGVELPVDRIIGGPEYAGQGWRMLMEALSAGRSVSLPAQSVGGAKGIARAVGAYAMVRRQFGMPVGRFEGIEEPLTRIAGTTYLMEAARVATCRAIDAGERPAVVSGIVKHRQTELLRDLATDGMDVTAGAGISLGPKNFMARGWTGAPIGITVEGANILTRTLIIFGQGAIRSHPWALRVLRAAQADDGPGFRRAVLGHVRSVIGNLLRAPWRSVTRGAFIRAPSTAASIPGGETKRYWKRLARVSSTFAALADLAMIVHGGRLKLRGKLTGRLADALGWCFFAACTLRRYEAEARTPERREQDLPLVRWAAEHCLSEADRALHGALENFAGGGGGRGFLPWLLRGPVALWSRLAPIATPPGDRLGAEVAEVIRRPGPRRDRLTADVYLPELPVGSDPGSDPAEADADDEPVAVLEAAFLAAAEAEPILARMREAAKKGKIPSAPPDEVADEAVAAGVIGPAEAEIVRRAAALRREVVRVDEYSAEEYLGTSPVPEKPEPALSTTT